MGYKIQLDVYEGPLDLLHSLISKNKIEIKDISIVDITNQYLDHLKLMRKIDMEVTSEFVAMATKLLEIKSRYLLHNEDNEKDELKENLMEQLKEYKVYKEAALEIKKIIESENERFFRNKEEFLIDEDISFDKITISKILEIANMLFISNNKRIKIIEEDEKLNNLMSFQVVSVEEKIDHIKNIMKKKSMIKFSEIVNFCKTDDVIATFLSILELINVNEIVVDQNEFFNDIIIKEVIN